MRLYIPEVGDLLKLESDWTFTLYNEHRNKRLFEAFNIEYDTTYHKLSQIPKHQVTLPTGTILKVDRVYIRKGISEYSSLSFFINYHEDNNFIGKRFWAKLNDVNNIDYSIPENSKRNPIIKIKTYLDNEEIKQPIEKNYSIYSESTTTPDVFKRQIDPNNVKLEYFVFVDGVLQYKVKFKNVVVEVVENKYGTWLNRIIHKNYMLRDFECEVIHVDTKEIISRATTNEGIKQAIKKHLKKN